MKNALLGGSLALALALGAAPATADDDAAEGTRVTITGCVADADSDDFVLTHVQKVADGAGKPPTTNAVLGAEGLEPGPDEKIYWLSKDSVKKMRGHVGHKVQVTGTVTDVSTGTVKVEKEPGKTGPDNEVEVSARGKEADAETERPVDREAAPAPRVKQEKKRVLPVHRIDVETVRMIAATCP